MCAELRHRTGTMDLDGFFRRSDDRGDLFVEAARRDEGADLRFTRGDRFGGSPELRQALALRTLMRTVLNGAIDCHEESRLVEWLLEQVEGAELHRLDRGIEIGAPGNEDRGRFDTGRSRFPQHRQAIHVRNFDIHDETGWLHAFLLREIGFGGGERTYSVAGIDQHSLNGAADAFVVIDDDDQSFRLHAALLAAFSCWAAVPGEER